MVCFSETKLQSPLFLGGFWSFQTMLRRSGGCWNASRTNTNLQLMKALGTYLCWTQLQLGNHYVQVLNCYLQPGEQQNLKERAKRVAEVVRDIIKQDPNAPIVVCGDFNNHMTYIVEQLGPLSFTAAVEPSTETHRQGGHLDQVFARNMTFGEVNLSPGYSDEVSDHKCLGLGPGESPQHQLNCLLE